MSERDPVLPYNTEFLSDWCNARGIDYGKYETLYVTDFRIAQSRLRELSVAQQFRHEIINSLPLEHCELVDDPRVKPGGSSMPTVYKAPSGMAFKLMTQHEYAETDEWGDEVPNAPTKIHETIFVGEYLDIKTRVIAGEPDGTIKVFEHPTFYALPAVDPGMTMVGPDESRMIRLPSRYDPEKDGAYVAFARTGEWDIVRSGGKASGEYGRTTVELVPSAERKADTELYVAEFDTSDDRLDDFLFIDEMPILPPGSGYLPGQNGEQLFVHNAVGNLVLPPIEDRNYWTYLWEQHGIMLKWHPTATRPRFMHLDFDRPLETANIIQEYNSHNATGENVGQVLLVRNIGTASLDEIVRVVTT